MSSLPSHVEAHRARDGGILDAEAFRVAGAVAALVASALFLAGGLLWRERVRGELEHPPEAVEGTAPTPSLEVPPGQALLGPPTTGTGRAAEESPGG